MENRPQSLIVDRVDTCTPTSITQELGRSDADLRHDGIHSWNVEPNHCDFKSQVSDDEGSTADVAFGRKPTRFLETSAIFDTPLGDKERYGAGCAALSLVHAPNASPGRARIDDKATGTCPANEKLLRVFTRSTEATGVERVGDLQHMGTRAEAMNFDKAKSAMRTGFSTGHGQQLRVASSASLARVARLFHEDPAPGGADKDARAASHRATAAATGFSTGHGQQLQVASSASLARVARLFSEEAENRPPVACDASPFSEIKSIEDCHIRQEFAHSRAFPCEFRNQDASSMSIDCGMNEPQVAHMGPSSCVNAYAAPSKRCIWHASNSNLPRKRPPCSMDNSKRAGNINDQDNGISVCHARPPFADVTSVEAPARPLSSRARRFTPPSKAEAPMTSIHRSKTGTDAHGAGDAPEIQSLPVCPEHDPKTGAHAAFRGDAARRTGYWSPALVPKCFPRPPCDIDLEHPSEHAIRAAFAPWESIRFRFKCSRNDADALITKLESLHATGRDDTATERLVTKLRAQGAVLDAWDFFCFFCVDDTVQEIPKPDPTDTFWLVSQQDFEPTVNASQVVNRVGSLAWFRRYWCLVIYEMSLIELAVPQALFGRVLTVWQVLYQLIGRFWRCHRRMEQQRSSSIFEAIARAPDAFSYLPPVRLLLVPGYDCETSIETEHVCLLLCDGHYLVFAKGTQPVEAWLHHLRVFAATERALQYRPHIGYRSVSAPHRLWTRAGCLHIGAARVECSAAASHHASRRSIRTAAAQIERISLTLSLNSVHPAPLFQKQRWSMKRIGDSVHQAIGRVQSAFMAVTLPQTDPLGGTVPALDVVLHRVHPLRFVAETLHHHQQQRQLDKNGAYVSPRQPGTLPGKPRYLLSATYTAQIVADAEHGQLHACPVPIFSWSPDAAPRTPGAWSACGHPEHLESDACTDAVHASGHVDKFPPKIGSLLTLGVADPLGKHLAKVEVWDCPLDLAQLLRTKYEGSLVRLCCVVPVSAQPGVWRLLGSAKFGVNIVPLETDGKLGARVFTRRVYVHWPRQRIRVSGLETLTPFDTFDAAPGLRLLYVGALRGGDIRQAQRYAYAADDPDGPLLVIRLRYEDAVHPPRCLALDSRSSNGTDARISPVYPLIHFEHCQYRCYESALDAHVVDATPYTTWHASPENDADACAACVAFEDIACIASRIAHGQALGHLLRRCRERRRARVKAWISKGAFFRSNVSEPG